MAEGTLAVGADINDSMGSNAGEADNAAEDAGVLPASHRHMDMRGGTR